MAFQRFRIEVEDGSRLEAVRLVPRSPRALVIAVPLIGGTGQQQISLFRFLVRRGVEVASFTFRGHRGSDGAFSFESTVSDTAHAVESLAASANDAGLPVHLLGASYATIPLLLNLTTHPEWAIRSFVAVSGFPTIDDLMVLFNRFLSHYASASTEAASPEDLVQTVTDDPTSLNQGLFRATLRDYLARRFPSISVSTERFEVLEFSRVDLIEELALYRRLLSHDLEGLRTRCPSLWIYARHDDVLELTDEEARERYRQRVLKIAPQATFCEADMDHWANGPDHDLMAGRVAAFLLEREA